MATSPTQRTLAECRKRGWLAQVVERWNPYARIRQDLFGFGDVIALDRCPGALLIQATSGANAAARLAKIQEKDEARQWLEAGNRIAVWAWAKRGARGKRKLWTLREVEVTPW